MPASHGHWQQDHRSLGLARPAVSGVGPRSNAAAQRACMHVLGGRNTPAQTRQQLGQALRFAACMRSNGDPEFPDPSVRQGGVVLHMIGSDTPQGQPAVQTCERLTRYSAE